MGAGAAAGLDAEGPVEHERGAGRGAGIEKKLARGTAAIAGGEEAVRGLGMERAGGAEGQADGEEARGGVEGELKGRGVGGVFQKTAQAGVGLEGPNEGRHGGGGSIGRGAGRSGAGADGGIPKGEQFGPFAPGQGAAVAGGGAAGKEAHAAVGGAGSAEAGVANGAIEPGGDAGELEASEIAVDTTEDQLSRGDEAEADVGDFRGESRKAGIGEQSSGRSGESGGLGGARRGAAKENRTREIGGLDDIRVDDGDGAKTEETEGLDDLIAERAGTDDQSLQGADASGGEKRVLKA